LEKILKCPEEKSRDSVIDAVRNRDPEGCDNRSVSCFVKDSARRVCKVHGTRDRQHRKHQHIDFRSIHSRSPGQHYQWQLDVDCHAQYQSFTELNSHFPADPSHALQWYAYGVANVSPNPPQAGEAFDTYQNADSR
jgi:hypothetical protein